MKIGPDRADSFCARPDPKVRVVLVYGPDEGLVRERVTRLMKTVVDDLADPFRVADLTAQTVKADPALLADEAQAMALTGGRRVIRLRDADDGVAKAVEAVLEGAATDTLVVVQGGDLSGRSTLRKLLEGAPAGAAVPCYLDDAMAVETVVRDSLAAHGIGVDRDAMDFLVAHLGGDRMVTRSEIDKLITYMGGHQGDGAAVEVTLDDAMACVGDVSAMSMDDLIFAVADGDDTTAQALLDRLLAEGQSVIGILRAASRHFMRLHLAGGVLAQGRSMDQAMASLKPPVFWKVRGRFQGQLRRWSPPRAAGALDLLLEAEIDCKTTGMPESEITSRAFLKLCRMARTRA